MKSTDTSRSDSPGAQTTRQGKIRVLVLDDHDFVRRGLCAMINAEQDMVVCGAGAVSRFDVASLGSLQPDVVVLDVGAHERVGVGLVEMINALPVAPRVVALAMYSRPKDVRQLASAGASDFVFGLDEAEHVLTAVRRAVVKRSGARRPRSEQLLPRAARQGSSVEFKPQEREVMGMIGAGVPAATIAVRLRVSLRTVHAYIRRIREKAKVATGIALVRYCVQWRRRWRRSRG